MKENVRKKQTLVAIILFAILFAATSIGVIGVTNARATSTEFGIDLTKTFNSNGGSTAGVGNGIICISTTGGYNQAASWGVMQTVTAVDGGGGTFLTNESLLVIKKIGDATAKTAKEWNTDDANNVKRIAGYGGSLIIYFDAQTTIGQKDVEYITLKTGFVLGNGAGWGNGAVATAIPESALTKDVTIYANQKSKMFEPAIKGMPTEMEEGAIKIKTAPTKVEYQQGATFDPTGMVITVKLNDDSIKDINVTADMVTYDFATAGEKDVTISYGGGSIVQKVTVTEELDVSFTVKPGYKTDYFFGNSIDTTTLNFEITTNKGNKRDASYEDVKSRLKITGFDTTLVAKGADEPLAQSVTLQIDNLPSQEITVNITDVTVDKPITAVYETDASTRLEVKFFVSGAVSGLSNDIWGIQNAEFAKNKIFISYKKDDEVFENKTVKEIQDALGATAMPRAMYTYEVVEGGFNLVLRFHMDEHATLKPADITRITVKRGLYWYNGGTSGFTARLDEVALLDDTYFDIVNGKTAKATETFTVSGSPTKVKYAAGEKFDPTGLTANATYVDGTSGAVTITEAMCSYDFSIAGTDKSVVINYNGKEHTINGIEAVGVSTAILKTAPTKLSYNIGEKIDLSGAKLALTMTDGTKKDIDVDESMLDKYDAFVVGEKEINIIFTTFTLKFNVTYSDASPDSYMTVSTNSNVYFQNKTLAVTMHFNNITDSRRAIWHIEKATNAKEKIYFYCKIGASEEYEWKSVGELMVKGSDNKPMVARVNAYGDTVEFHLDSADLLKTNVKRIKIVKGFYLCKSPSDFWGTDGSAQYTYMENAIFRHDVIIENPDDRKWVRPFAEGEDSLTIISQPTKTEYTVGDKVDPAGLKINVKYLDGFAEEIAITINEIAKPTLSEAGDAIVVTAVFNGRQFNFTVKVTEAAADPVTPGTTKKGCGCGSSITYASVIIALVILCGAVIISIRCKKKED